MGTVVFLQGTFTFKKGCYAHYSILATLTTTYMTQQRRCYFINPLQDSKTIVKTSKKTQPTLVDAATHYASTHSNDNPNQMHAITEKRGYCLSQDRIIIKKKKKLNATQCNETHSTPAATNHASTYINENPVKCTHSQRRDWLPASVKFESKTKEKQTNNSTPLNAMKHTAHLLPRIMQAPTAIKTQSNARIHKEGIGCQPQS